MWEAPEEQNVLRTMGHGAFHSLVGMSRAARLAANEQMRGPLHGKSVKAGVLRKVLSMIEAGALIKEDPELCALGVLVEMICKQKVANLPDALALMAARPELSAHGSLILAGSERKILSVPAALAIREARPQLSAHASLILAGSETNIESVPGALAIRDAEPWVSAHGALQKWERSNFDLSKWAPGPAVGTIVGRSTPRPFQQPSTTAAMANKAAACPFQQPSTTAAMANKAAAAGNPAFTFNTSTLQAGTSNERNAVKLAEIEATAEAERKARNAKNSAQKKAARAAKRAKIAK